MTPATDTLLNAILQLSEAERAECAARLLESLGPTADLDSDMAWDEEIRTRIEDVQTGRVPTIPWFEARARILADDDGDS